ncbi:hypothetical protein [Persephonella sp. IF05-L8]|uniref:hypothetical protein n=1 Tax=Persephonella sp. IF05-L8 TaxID=1158338 RepID=UPI000495FD4A
MKILETITKLDILKKAQECIDENTELKGHVKIDIEEKNKTDADLDIVIITDLPDEWDIRDKITFSIYQCLEEIDPYITIHFNWKFTSD